MTTILIGRKELFSFADRHSAGRLADYSGLGDGEVLCCLFSLVFPDHRIRPAPAQTHSSTQRGHANWDSLFRRFARLHIPLPFLNPAALQAGDAECGFSTLVLFYFLHHLSKRADFAAEFALDVADEVTAYLQSTACIVTLLLGNALDWTAVPPALTPALRQHPAFDMAEGEVDALEAAAARTYRLTYARPRQRSSNTEQPQRRTRAAAEPHDERVTAVTRRGRPPAPPPHAAAVAAAGDSSSSRSASSTATHSSAEQGGAEATGEEDSPVPRPPYGAAAPSSHTCASYSSRNATPPAPPPPFQHVARRPSATASSAASSAVSSLSFTAARTSASRASSAGSSAASTSRASSLGGSTAYAASGSTRPRTPAPLYRTAASVRPAPSSLPAVTELEGALQRKEAECEALQMRVAQLLTHLADARAAAAAAAVAPRPTPASETARYEARIAELEAQLRDAGAERLRSVAPRSPCPPALDAARMHKAALEAEIAALTADVVQTAEGEDGPGGGASAGTRIDVHETANLLHCLMLEQLHDAPRNRSQMQRWLWSIVEAHHTLEGRLMAAVDLLRVWSASLDEHHDARKGRAASASTARRSASTVAAAFFEAAGPTDDASASTGVAAAAETVADGVHEERLASVRSAHVAELAALHAREHALRTALESAQLQHATTVQRAVRRERLWKALCASVYAAEQASYAITECGTAEQVEARLREREQYYRTVEALTQQLVEEGPHEKAATTSTADGVRSPVGAPAAAAGMPSPCASMQALVQRLQGERDELLGEVARLRTAMSAMQQQRQGSQQRELPVKRVADARGSAAATTTAAAGDFEAWMASFAYTSPDASHGLAALLHAHEAPAYRSEAAGATR